MLSLQIQDKNIEETLLSQFQSVQKVQEYLYNLIIEDLEDKRFGNILKNNHKKELVDKQEIFDLLANKCN